MSPSIAFFGSSLVSAYWNGAATYYRGVLQALAANGHRVTFYEPDAYDRQRHRDIPDPDWAKVVVYPATTDGVDRALDQARDADLLVKASGVGVFDALLEARIPSLKRSGAIAAFQGPRNTWRILCRRSTPANGTGRSTAFARTNGMPWTMNSGPRSFPPGCQSERAINATHL